MEKQLRKEYKWIFPVVVVGIIISICTACDEEKDEQVMMVSEIEEQLDDLAAETVNVGGESAEDDVETIEADEANIADDKKNVETDRKSEEDNTETSETDEEGEADEWNVDFEDIGAEYIYKKQRNEIEIHYPKLCGLEDPEKEERINDLIEEDVMQIVGEKNKEGDDNLYCVGLDYKIKFLNERIISILYKGWEGYVTRGHAALDDEAIAVTIDIEEEKVITLQDVVTDFTELSDMLLADKFEHITMWEGEAGGYKVSMEYEKDEDKLEDDLRGKYQHWYTDGKNFVIIIEKRADYNEYSISNESVGHILDAGFLRKLE